MNSIQEEIADNIVDLLREIQQLQSERYKYKKALYNLVNEIDDSKVINDVGYGYYGITLEKDCEAVKQARQSLGKE